MKIGNPEAPGYVRWVTRTLEEAGYETWAVGGAIRNTLLGVPAGDWDLATRAPPTVVQELFPRTVPIGIEHGTVGVLTREGILLEVTTFRRDVETTGRHAVVEFADTLQEDLARRDFTINAVAWHPLRGEYQDPFFGRRDLDARFLKTVGDPRERFAEDYLRVLRALRFSGRFRLRIHGGTWEALCRCTDQLGTLSPERVREELLKVLAQDDMPSGALSLYGTTGVLEALYPELAAIGGCTRPGREEDLWVHSILLADVIPRAFPALRLVAILHGVGIPEGKEGGGAGAKERARKRAAALLIRGRYSNTEVRDVSELVGQGLEPPVDLLEPADLRRWLYMAGPERLRSFGRIWLGKARLDGLRWGMDPAPVLELLGRARAILRERPPLRVEDLAVNGRDLIGLGLRPGPHFGRILLGLMDSVLQDPDLNTREQLLEVLASTGLVEGEGT